MLASKPVMGTTTYSTLPGWALRLRIPVLLVLLLIPTGGLAQPGSPGEDDQPTVYDSQGRQVQPRPKPPPKPAKVTLPEPLNEVEPVYPPEAEAAGLEGEVILKLTIDTDGNVIGAEIHTPAGHGFDEAAIRAAKQLRFSPARQANGNPFTAIIKYRFRFHLKPKPPPPKPAKPTGMLRGKVLIRGLEEPLAGAQLRVVDAAGHEQLVRTDPAGAFVLPPLPPGEYQVAISATGYEALAVVETVTTGGELIATYRLSAEATGALEVIVVGDRPPREVTRRTLEKREIERIPGTSGDAIKSVQSLPGVARPPGIAGALIVRGSDPFDSQTFIDGVYVPIIYHFGGLSSVVPTELLSKIDFYPGNFSARFGRALGGIIDAGIRSPRGDGYHGLAQLDLIDARLMFEGPIPLVDGWTFAAAARRSHMDAWLGPILEAAGAGVAAAPRYWDYQLLVERKWSDAKLRVSFYGSDDVLEALLEEPSPGEPALAGNVGFSTAFQRLQAGYEVTISQDSRFETQISLGHEDIGIDFAGLFVDLQAFTLFARSEYSHRLGRTATANIGLDLMTSAVDFSARLPAFGQPGQPSNQPFSTRGTISTSRVIPVFQPAGYVEAELTPLSRWRIVPGVRLDYSKDTDELEVSPRLNSRFDIVEQFPRTTVKGGIGVFTQPPQPFQSNPPMGTAGISAERAIHYGLGLEQEITKQLEGSIEGFYKQLDRMIISEPTSAGIAVRYTNNALGNVFGGELLLKYKPDDRFFGWLAYTLSRAVRQNSPDAEEVHLPYDQTHILTVLGSYRLGHGWEVGARFRLISGNLVDTNVCNAAAQSCDPNRINAMFHAASGAYTPLRFGGDNSERLPLFHQLDLRIDKIFQFEDWKLSAYLDVQNIYNNQNVEGIEYDYRFSTRQFVTGLPMLPSIGLRGEL